jgi:hypothetical protein
MESSKRSQIVVLSLVGLPLGAIALAEAFPAQEMRRNLYSDRASCERDYSADRCSSHGVGLGGGGGGYCGPYYNANRSLAAAKSDPGPGRTGQVTRTETSVRHGFGAFGRAVHAAGS